MLKGFHMKGDIKSWLSPEDWTHHEYIKSIEEASWSIKEELPTIINSTFPNFE